MVDRHRHGEDTHPDDAPEGQHRDHGDHRAARPAHDGGQAVGKRQQAEERGAGAYLQHAEGNALRLLGEGPDEQRRQPVQQRPDQLCQSDRADDAEPRALSGALQLPGAQVLPDKGGDGSGKAGDGQKSKALHLGIGAAPRHGHLAKGVDIGLHHHVGQRDHRILQSGGEAVLQDQPGHFAVKTHLPPSDLVFAGDAHQPPQAQRHADKLRKDGGQRRALHPHAETRDQQDIQRHVGDGGGDEVVQRVAAVAHRLHNALALVIHHQPHAAGKIGADVGGRLRHDPLRGAHPAQHLRGEQHPHHGKESPRRQAEGNIGMDGGAHLFGLPRTEKAGDHHAGAHRYAAEKAHQQKYQRAGAGNRRQGAVAQQVADDQRVGGIVELLEQVAQQQRHRKGYQLLCNRAFGHSDFGCGHAAVLLLSHRSGCQTLCSITETDRIRKGPFGCEGREGPGLFAN